MKLFERMNPVLSQMWLIEEDWMRSIQSIKLVKFNDGILKNEYSSVVNVVNWGRLNEMN